MQLLFVSATTIKTEGILKKYEVLSSLLWGMHNPYN